MPEHTERRRFTRLKTAKVSNSYELKNLCEFYKLAENISAIMSNFYV